MTTDQTKLGMVDIKSVAKQLSQILQQQEWDGEVDKAKATQHELDSLLDYHNKTGSMWYPLF
jgi:hypothetical protein